MSTATKTIEAKARSLDAERIIHWVGAAASNDTTRHFLNGIYVESVDEQGARDPSGNYRRLVATDGRRLHMATLAREALEPFGLEPCTLSEAGYKVLRHSKTKMELGEMIEGQFPNYRRVIPEPINPETTIDIGERISPKYTKVPDDQALAFEFYGIVNRETSGVRLNPKYLQDLFLYDGLFIARFWAHHKALRFDHNNNPMVGVIMPMELE